MLMVKSKSSGTMDEDLSKVLKRSGIPDARPPLKLRAANPPGHPEGELRATRSSRPACASHHCMAYVMPGQALSRSPQFVDPSPLKLPPPACERSKKRRDSRPAQVPRKTLRKIQEWAAV